MTAIHTTPVRMFPLKCKNKGCSEFRKTVYLPFSEKRGVWKKFEEASETCLGCDRIYTLCCVNHLVIPDENGQVHGSLEVGPGNFVDHPIKRWEFLCENAKRGYAEQQDSIDYPRFFTTVPHVANCYDCVEGFSKLDGEEQNKLMDYFRSKE